MAALNSRAADLAGRLQKAKDDLAAATAALEASRRSGGALLVACWLPGGCLGRLLSWASIAGWAGGMPWCQQPSPAACARAAAHDLAATHLSPHASLPHPPRLQPVGHA